MAIESIERLTVQLGKLPGIGRKTAARLAYHILGVPPEQAQELAQAITDARTKVHNCPVCGTYTDGELCEICADPRRRTDVICVVSDPKDVIAMEKTREFKGRYHVLFGALSPMEGIGPKELHLDVLEQLIDKYRYREIILATNPTVEGDATAHFIGHIASKYQIPVSQIARGIPVGGELDAIDGSTLMRSFTGRRPL